MRMYINRHTPLNILVSILVLFLAAGCNEEDDNKKSTHPDKVLIYGGTEVVSGVSFRPNAIPKKLNLNPIADLGILETPQGAAIDPVKEKIYIFTTFGVIRESDFKFNTYDSIGHFPEGTRFGSNEQYGSVQGMIVSEGVIYWIESAPGDHVGRVASSLPNGTKYINVYKFNSVDSLGSRGVVQPAGTKDIYWANETKIWKGTITGSEQPVLLFDIATDTTHGIINGMDIWKDKIYIATTKGLWETDLRQPGVLKPLFTEITANAKNVPGVAVDKQLDEIYWSFEIERVGYLDYQFLFRGKLSGTDPEKIYEKNAFRNFEVY